MNSDISIVNEPMNTNCLEHYEDLQWSADSILLEALNVNWVQLKAIWLIPCDRPIEKWL